MPDVTTLLHHASIFLYNPVSASDIEEERKRLEAQYRTTLQLLSAMPVKRHGIDCTKVTWQVV